jgi:amino acid transporter/mannitol/fructose-specific phosphotransferase system IIA component (Ntr-type)
VQTSSRSLHKGLSFIDVFCLAAGAMISSGIFILPGMAYAQVGPAVIISYALAGGLALIGILNVAELVTAMPRAGGDYYYVNRSLGPLTGTIAGLLSWFALSLKTSFAVFGMSEVIHLFTGWPVFLIAVPICMLFTALNIFGVKEAARLEVMLVVGLLVLMVLYFFYGLRDIRPVHYTPVLPHGMNAMLSTAGFVFVSFGGLLNVATVAEEVKDPGRIIAPAFIAAVVVITVFYAGLLFVTIGVLPPEQLSASLTPLADTAQKFAGRTGYIVITVAAMLAFITTANAGIMAASRYPLALSRDHLIPSCFQYISRRFGTPVTAVAVTGGVILLSLLLNLEWLVKAASTVVLTTYALAGLAVIVLRQSGLQNYRPTFRVPGYPWVPGLGIVLFAVLIIDMGPATIEISLGLVLAGLLTYLFYGRRRSRQEYALLHLIERITAKDLASYSLESELKAIIHERDQVQNDPFDRAIQKASITDIADACDRESLFNRIADELVQYLPLTQKDILNRLCEREAESSTAISDFVAVPHLVIPGTDAFQLMLVRCRQGVHWSKENPAIRAVFVICGTKDCRNLHLKSLAAIAHIVQHPSFEKRWMQVKHPEQLRDIILITERKRP